MKKFKLLKKYPGLTPLLKIGDIVTKDASGHYSSANCYRSEWCDEYFESFPENWQIIPLLFKTEDGVAIFTGDSWWYVVLSTLKAPIQTNKYTTISNSEVKRFSTKEAAWKFINKTQKPVLFKTEDGKEIRKGDTTYGVSIPYFSLKAPIVHYSTDFLYNGIKEFSTQQLAQLYVDQNKPQYSLQNILDAANRSKYPGNEEYVFIDLLKLTGK